MTVRRMLSWLAGGAALCALLAAPRVSAEWTHRYPRIAGYNHQIYLEGYDLPALNAGPGDAAAAPDGRSLAVAARGHLFLVPLAAAGEARQLTRGRDVYARPAWAPDGRSLAAVRDTGTDTAIVRVQVATGEVTVLADSPALDLDPSFSPDGRALFYSSAEAGDLDLWRLDLATGQRTRLTRDPGQELRPLPVPVPGGSAGTDGSAAQLVYLTQQRNGADTVSLLDLQTGKSRVLLRASIASQLRPALSRDGRRLVVNLPDDASLGDELRLWVLDLTATANNTAGVLVPLSYATPAGTAGAVSLVSGTALGPGLHRPLMPAWTADGSAVLFSVADVGQRFRLLRVPVTGGPPAEVPVRLPEPPARVFIRTRVKGIEVSARLNIEDADGHPIVPEVGAARLDGQSGLTYVYSPGALLVPVPPGKVRIVAARGLAAPAVRAEVDAAAGKTVEAALDLQPLIDPRERGYFSGDHHFHLNYGGPYTIGPGELAEIVRAEDLDVATPMVANLHTRLLDLPLWERHGPAPRAPLGSLPPLIAFGHEVRSHFLGHVGLIGVQAPFWPWYWGPGYPSYGADDRPNSDALAAARAARGVGTYVHPVAVRDPFAAGAEGSIPLGLVTDAVLGDVDALEIACLWTDELGTEAVWHRLLGLGIPVAPTAGTDAMANLYRNMAVGTARVYVRPAGKPASEPRAFYAAYLDALRAGRSFVTTGPLLDFVAGGTARPGDVAGAALAPGGQLPFRLEVASTAPLERVEVLVNGVLAWSAPVHSAPAAPGVKVHTGQVPVPAGGYVVARAVGADAGWPSMDSYPYALTGPIWLGRARSTDPETARRAAGELLRVLRSQKQKLGQGYPGASAPRLRERFDRAEALLTKWQQSGVPAAAAPR